jgi:hypothetical protein
MEPLRRSMLFVDARYYHVLTGKVLPESQRFINLNRCLTTYIPVDSPQSEHPLDPKNTVTWRIFFLYQDRVLIECSASVAAKIRHVQGLFDLKKPALRTVDCTAFICPVNTQADLTQLPLAP